MSTITTYAAYIMFGIGAIGLLYLGGRWLLGKVLSGVKWPSFNIGGGGADNDTLDFQAWNRLLKRKSFQTPEAKAALKVLAANFVEVA